MKSRELVEVLTERDPADMAYDEAVDAAVVAAFKRLQMGAGLPDALLHAVQVANRDHHVHVDMDAVKARLEQHVNVAFAPGEKVPQRNEQPAAANPQPDEVMCDNCMSTAHHTEECPYSPR
jgi:hypothetical protein